MARASSRPVKTLHNWLFPRGLQRGQSCPRGVRAVWDRASGTGSRAKNRRNPGTSKQIARRTIRRLFNIADLLRIPVDPTARNDGSEADIGGDELFAGYERYATDLRRRVFDWIPHWAGQCYRDYVYPRLPSTFVGRRFLFNISLPPRDRYLDSISFLPACHRERGLFSGDFLDSRCRAVAPLNSFQSYFDNAPADKRLSRLLYLDTKTYLPGGHLDQSRSHESGGSTFRSACANPGSSCGRVGGAFA